MALRTKQLHDGGIQVEDDTGHWILFTLNELRSPKTKLTSSMVSGSPSLAPMDAELFVWAAFAAARGFAREHGLLEAAQP